MKKTIIYTAFWLATAGIALTSCEDIFGGFLDKHPSNELTKERYSANGLLPASSISILTTSCATVPAASITHGWMQLPT